MIADDFYRFRFLSFDYSGMQLHVELDRRYFERVGDLNPENLSAYKPGQYQPSEEDLKPGFNERILRCFKDLFESDKCLINNKVINVSSFDSQLQISCQ